MDVGQVGGAGVGDPLAEPGVVARGWASRAAKDVMRLVRLVRMVISGQAAVSPASVSCWPGVRRSGLVSRIRAVRRGDRCGRSPSIRPRLM
jgi:hypothetical protein